VTGKFLSGGFVDGVNAKEPGIEALSEALDGSSFASGVGALDDDDDRNLLLMELELHVEKLELILLHLTFVFLLSEGFRLVEVVETDAFFWHGCREAVFRQDLQDEQEKGGGN
jgi:hypothetical protein